MTLFGITVNRRQGALLIADAVLVLLAISVSNTIRLGHDFTPEQILLQWQVRTGASFFAVFVHLSFLYIFECYSTELDYRRAINVVRVGISVGLSGLALSVIYFLLPNWGIGRGVLTVHTFFVMFGLTMCRVVYSSVVGRAHVLRAAAVVGAGPSGRLLAETLGAAENPEMLVTVFIDCRPELAGTELAGVPVVSPALDDLPGQFRALGIREVIIADRDGWDEDLIQRILAARVDGLPVQEMVRVFKRVTGRVPVGYVDNAYFLFGPGFSLNQNVLVRNLFRLFDIGLATIGLILSAPLQILTALAVLIFNGRPVFFAQERLGKDEEPFVLYKFRTMIPDAEKGSGPKWAASDDPRVTRLGRFLRRSRLDEMPQLWNVLSGVMSFIGPRPERKHFVDQLRKEIPFYALRFTVRPGITGWAQVNYRYGASREDAQRKLEYELFYVQEMSLFLNILILAKTVQTILLRRGS
ncbi:MAG: sugar transferase [Pseudomonadota bacterium]